MKNWIVVTLAWASLAFGSDSKFDERELIPTEVVITEQANARLLAAQQQPSNGGGSSTIGTDSYDVRTHTSWFYGSKPIVTCFNHVESFGPSAKQASAAIEASIKRWQTYFKEKKIAKGSPELSPNANFKLKGRCQGDEDLVIFLGTGPIFAGLQDLKAVQRLNFPIAYANKTYMSRDLKWSKGYIRLVASGYYGGGTSETLFPDWRKPGSLESVLTHELGHVLGFLHTRDTIMRAELVEQVFSKEPRRIEIDGAKQLVSCNECSTTYRIAGSPNDSALFEKLGLKSTTKLLLEKTGDGFYFTDGKTKVRLVETSRTVVDSSKTLVTNFTESLNDSSQTFNVYSYVALGESKTPLVLEYNSGSAGGAIILRSVEKGEIREIGRFEAL